jgi:hypothetical protein
VHLQRPGDEVTPRLPADVLLDALDERVASPRDAALVVVELDVLDEERSEALQVARVVRLEQLRSSAATVSNRSSPGRLCRV